MEKRHGNIGNKHSEETTKKIGFKNKGRKRTKKFKENLSRIHTGKKVSIKTTYGVMRSVDMLASDPLPRIC